MRIYLIRHGESTSDIENKYGGAYDDHLTEKGKTEAGILTDKLVGKGIEAIYASPKLRAKEASDIVNQRLRLPLEVVNGLEERDYGILGGMNKDEAQQKYPVIVEKHKNIYNTDPEGESYEDFKARVLAAFQAIIENNRYQTIAIFSHGGPIKLIYRELFKQGELGDLGDYGILELEKNGELQFIAQYTSIS